MMKIGFPLIVLLLIAQCGTVASTTNPYREIVGASCFRLCQAADRNDGVSDIIVRAKQCWISSRFDKIATIRINRLGKQGLTVMICSAGGKYQTFSYPGGLEHTTASTIEPDAITGDIPVPPAMAKLAPSRLGKEAAKIGFDAFYENGKPVLIEKFFRRDMTEEERRSAVMSTIENDVGKPDWTRVQTDVTVNSLLALKGVRQKLENIPWFNRGKKEDRWYNWREFPISVQKSIERAIELFYAASEWGFLYEINSQVVK